MDLSTFPLATSKYAIHQRKSTALSTGCANIDALLGGGVSTGEVTEVYGASGSGKTQLAYSLISQVSRSGENSALLIDTDGSFVAGRFVELGADTDAVHVIRLSEANEILACLPVLLPAILTRIGNVRLVVLDSFSFIARNCTYPATLRRLFLFIDRLAHISVTQDIAILITNDTKPSAPDHIPVQENEYAVPVAGLGAKWTTICATRIALATSRDSERYAALVKHARVLSGRVRFGIGPGGVIDVT